MKHVTCQLGFWVPVFALSVATAQPGGIGAPDAGVHNLSPGADTISFSGVPATIVDLSFVAEGYRTVAKLRPGPGMIRLLDGGWARPQGNRARGIQLKGVGPATVRCAVPEEAVGLVLRYMVLDGLFASLDVSLNGSKAQLQPVHREPYECVIALSREGGKVQFDGEPILNLWSLRGYPPGAVFDETHCEIDVSPGNDPLSAGEYRLHVSYVADPRRVSNPSAPSTARLRGIDVTPYDGYVVTVKAEDARRFTAGLKDTGNFSWRGAGASLTPDQWCSLAVPFALHTNYTTAGDGVLKLSELDHLRIGVGGRPKGAPVTGEYWVKPPKFYTGEPPEGIPVAEKAPRDVCAVTSLSAERRKPHVYEGIAIQAIQQQGDSLWLGTDRGIMKVSPADPATPLATYTMSEGLVDDDVQCLYADGDDLWIGTTCGVSRLTGDTFTNLTSDDGLLPGPVMAITSDQENVWFGMARGIAKYERSTKHVTARKGRGGWSPESTGGQGVPVQEGRGIFCDSIAVDKDGSLWHAAAGMTHSSVAGRRMAHYGGTTKRVLGVYPVGDHVWCVSSRSIEVLAKDDLEEKIAGYPIARRKGIGGERHNAFITCAYPQRDGIWLGYSDGIGWFSLKDRQCFWSPSYSVRMGSLVAQSIFADANHVWVGTDNGLLRFAKAEALNPWPVLEYSAPTDLWAAGVFLDTDADLVFGCADGCEDDEGGYSESYLQNVTLDEAEGVRNSPGALLLDFSLERDADSEAVLSQRFNLDLSGCTGVSFCAKTDGAFKGKPREFYVDVVLQASMAPPKGARRAPLRNVVLREVINVHPEWRVFKLSFKDMKLVSGPGPGRGRGRAAIPQSIHLRGVHVGRSVADFQCAGDRGKLWMDRLQLLGKSTGTRSA